VPLRNMTHMEVIKFVQEHIIHRFGIPHTLTTDQGSSFMSQQFKEFAGSLKIELLNLSVAIFFTKLVTLLCRSKWTCQS
jgi:hypothetical protein